MRTDATAGPKLGHKKAKISAKDKPAVTPQRTATYKNYKRPAFVAAVLARHAAGDSGRAIARELGVARATVERVLKQPGIEQKAQKTLENVENKVLADFEKSVEDARTFLHAKLPDLMQMAVNDTLEKRDRALAHEIVKRAGVYPDKEKPKVNAVSQDNRLQVAIKTLIMPQRQNKVIPPAVLPEPSPNENVVTDVTPVTDATEQSIPEPVTPGHGWNCECNSCKFGRLH